VAPVRPGATPGGSGDVERMTVSWFTTSRTRVSRHAGLMSPEIPE
jgi:hypothetical protein